MSIIYEAENCIMLDHAEYINNIYKKTRKNDSFHDYMITPLIFSVKNKEKMNKRKRKHNAQSVSVETDSIKKFYETFIENVPLTVKNLISEKYDIFDTNIVREKCICFFNVCNFDHFGINGGNNSLQSLICTINGEDFMIPPNSRFYSGCVKEQCLTLKGKRFEIVVADPPWWNKYIRRLKNADNKLSYSMMYNEDIAAIPIKDLFADNCLVVVWCTNSPSNIDAVKNIILPQWGVQYVTTWYWLKVTTDLSPLHNFNEDCKKQPYERIILGKVGEINDLPDNKLIVSIPSALHSHKPPLLEILKPYINAAEPQCLELFARYLLPNTTSVGFEPLKWQHISLYQPVIDECTST